MAGICSVGMRLKGANAAKLAEESTAMKQPWLLSLAVAEDWNSFEARFKQDPRA